LLLGNSFDLLELVPVSLDGAAPVVPAPEVPAPLVPEVPVPL